MSLSGWRNFIVHNGGSPFARHSVRPQVMGPHEMSANTRELLGRAKAEARLLEAHGWTPVHVIVGANKSVAKQVQQIAQAFGDPHVRASQKHQSSQLGGRAGMQQPAAGASTGNKSREGWVQWQQPKKNLEKKETGERESMSRAGSSDFRDLSKAESSMGQRRQGGPGASSPVRNHMPYAGPTHSLMASLAASVHR